MYNHSFFFWYSIIVSDQCKTNYLLIRALCYSTHQNRNNVLEESVSTWEHNVIKDSSVWKL